MHEVNAYRKYYTGIKINGEGMYRFVNEIAVVALDERNLNIT